jgi:hypothetical protein
VRGSVGAGASCGPEEPWRPDAILAHGQTTTNVLKGRRYLLVGKFLDELTQFITLRGHARIIICTERGDPLAARSKTTSAISGEV